MPRDGARLWRAAFENVVAVGAAVEPSAGAWRPSGVDVADSGRLEPARAQYLPGQIVAVIDTGGSLSVRERLAQLAAEEIETLLDVVRQGAKATKSVWHTCRHCNKRDQVEIPDVHAAVKAAEFALNQGFGRPKETSSESGDFVYVRELILHAPQEASLRRLLELVRQHDDPALLAAAERVEQEYERDKLVERETTRSPLSGP